MLFLHRARVHIERFPNVAVRILKPVLIHKAIVFRRAVSRAACAQRLAHHFIDLLAALAGQCDKRFRRRGGVADRFRRREPLEHGMRDQHGENGVADDQAGGRVVGELGVEAEAECFENSMDFGRSFTARLTKICVLMRYGW